LPVFFAGAYWIGGMSASELWDFVTGHPFTFGALVLGGILLLGLGLVWLDRADREKREALRRIAATHGLRFDGRKNLSDRAFFQLPLFRKDSSLSTTDVLHGSIDGNEVLLFTYEYQGGIGEYTQWPQRQTVAAIGVAGRRLPRFTLHPRVYSLLPGRRPNGLDFDTHERFSSLYALVGDDEAALRAIFDERLLDYFSDKPGWYVESGDDWLVIYRESQRVEHWRIPEHLAKVTDLARCVCG
jgi:hypothetical protein